MSRKDADDEERCVTDDKARRILAVYFGARMMVFETFSEDFQRQLIKGYQVELEHGKAIDPMLNVTDDNTDATVRIAMVHIMEVPDYYDRLEALEREGKAFWAGARRVERDRELHFVVASMGLPKATK